MKKTFDPSRCTECTRLFGVDPKIGDRQVTCGAEACQRSRHAEMCRRWHVANPDASSEHYGDVVAPFRREQPSYQRRWWLGRRLAEIREQSKQSVAAIGLQLQAALERATTLSLETAESAQSGAITRESLPAAMSAITTVMAALEQLATCSAALAVGGT